MKPRGSKRAVRICCIEEVMNLRTLAIALMACGAVAAAQSASSAQSTPSARDIVINGRKQSDIKAAEKYVSAIAVRTDAQLARFHQPLCAVVIGIARPYSGIIQKRINVDALAAGVEVSKNARCEPNLFVVISEDGAALIKDIRIHRPGWLGGLTSQDVDALLAPAPARAWSVTSLRNEDGAGLGRDPGSRGSDNLVGLPTLRVMSASIVRLPTRQDVEASFVVIDTAAMIGLTLRQVADYAAMRGLARTQPPAPGSSGLTTILSVLDHDGDRAPQLTDADSAYLRALYRSAGTDTALREKSEIARRIAKGK